MGRVLALKYRPKRFSDLIGQESVSQTLTSSLVGGKLSHAYLFSGLRGSGKTSTARIFAKALVCENRTTDEPCGVCSGCLAAEDGRHIDIIEMDAASNRKIEDVRALIESTKYKPSQSLYKVFIIDEVHMLTKEAFNALLKTLEEPPAYVKFILATTDPMKLPPTILSRTMHFRFKKIGHIKIVEHLKHILGQEKIEYENEALEIIARNGNGSLRDTLTLLDQAIVYSKEFVSRASVVELLGAVNPDKIEELFRLIASKDRASVLSILKDFEEYEAENILSEVIEFLKSNLLNPVIKIPFFAVERFFKIASEAKELLYIGADGQFVITLAVLKMLEALEIEDIDALIANYENGVTKQKKEPVQESKKIEPTESNEEKTTQKPDNWSLFVKALYDRSYDLGVVFTENVTFLSFEESVLTWQSKAKDDDRAVLLRYYAAIKQIAQEIYGIGTKIVNKEYTEEKRLDESVVENRPVADRAEVLRDKEPDVEASVLQEASRESSNENCETIDGSDELDIEASELDLIRHPLVQKTKEVFGVDESLITVFQKV